MIPNESMIPGRLSKRDSKGPNYQLRAVVTHYGRHENGHYICYRQHPAYTSPHEDEDKDKHDQKLKWWRLSDDDVSPVSEDAVLLQNGAFMLFYERFEDEAPSHDESRPSKALAENLVVAEPSRSGDSEVLVARDDDQQPAEVKLEDDNAHAQILKTSDAATDRDSTVNKSRASEALGRPEQAQSESSPMSTNLQKQTSPSVMRTSKTRSRRKKGNVFAGPPPVTAK